MYVVRRGLEKKAAAGGREDVLSIMDRRERQIRFRLARVPPADRGSRRRSDKRASMFSDVAVLVIGLDRSSSMAHLHEDEAREEGKEGRQEKLLLDVDCRDRRDGSLDYDVIEGKHVVTVDIGR